jgi:anti-sigma B factor antagonist
MRVRGELDLATVSELENAVADSRLSRPLVVDLTECSFLDSSAVRVLLATAAKAEEAGRLEVAVVAPNPGIRRALEIAGVDTMLAMHSTLAEVL